MEPVSLFKVLLAFLFVLSLIGLLAMLAKRYKLPEKLAGSGITTKRLSVQDVLYLDAKRRLVLIRRDNVEHLVLLGQGHETIVETQIQSQQTITQHETSRAS